MTKLEQVSAEVDGLKDGLGLGIDKKIKRAVIAFRLWDFSTTMSCEGHMNRALPYPWVDMEGEGNAKHAMSILLNAFYISREKDMACLKVVPAGRDGSFRVQSCAKLGFKEDTIDCVRDKTMLMYLQKEMNDFAEFLIDKHQKINGELNGFQ